MHGDDDDNSSFPVSVNYSSALLFLLLANISGLLFVFWIIGLENIFLNLVSGGKCQVKMAKLGFEKDCNNINEDNSNNNYNSCVFVNGIIKVIFVYVVVCCITGPTSPPPVLPPSSAVFSLLFSSFSLSFFFNISNRLLSL